MFLLHSYVLVLTYRILSHPLSTSISFVLRHATLYKRFCYLNLRELFLQVSKAIAIAIQFFVRNYDIISNLYSHTTHTEFTKTKSQVIF